MRIQSIVHLPFVAALTLAASCDKKADTPADTKDAPAGAATGADAKDAKDSKPAKGDASVQADLQVTIAGKAINDMYAFAQLDEGRGETYHLTFMDTPASCATMQSVMMKQHETMTFFTVDVQRALKSDGSMTWALAGAAFGNGGSVPASLVELAEFGVTDGEVNGLLPADVGHEDSEKGKLQAAGAFKAPICAPIKARKLRDWDLKEAVDLPVKDSTAKVTIAGKSFDVGGATAFPTPGGDEWTVRLSAKAHGCSMNVRDELVLEVRVGGEDVKLGLGGQLMAGGTMYRELEGLKVAHTKADDTIALELSGEQDFAPNDVAYKVSAQGKVSATICKAG